MKKAFAYMVTDDLSVTPESVRSATTLLQGKIKDIGALKERVVDVGPDEVRSSSLASLTRLNFDFITSNFQFESISYVLMYIFWAKLRLVFIPLRFWSC